MRVDDDVADGSAERGFEYQVLQSQWSSPAFGTSIEVLVNHEVVVLPYPFEHWVPLSF